MSYFGHNPLFPCFAHFRRESDAMVLVNLIRTRLLRALFLVLPLAAHAQFTFITNNSTITITAYTGTNAEVTIPASTNGFAVTVIGTNAFAGTGVTSVT